MEGSATKFFSILKEYIVERKKINPDLTNSQIARKLGVSRTTFFRIVNYHTYPNTYNFIKLCKSIPKLKTIATEDIIFKITKKSKTGKYMGKELENLLQDKNLFITYALALSSCGVTDEEIIYCLGHEGKKALRILMEKGLLMKMKNDKYKAINPDKGIIRSFELLKKHLIILAENYKPDNVKNNYIYYKLETLNKKGLKRLFEIYKETHRKVQEVMEEEECKGDIPIFSAGFFDMFFLKEPENKKEEEENNIATY